MNPSSDPVFHLKWSKTEQTAEQKARAEQNRKHQALEAARAERRNAKLRATAKAKREAFELQDRLNANRVQIDRDY